MQSQIWHHMFALGLPIAEKILRPIIIYAFLILVLRLAGKRELAQLNPFDLVVLLTLSNTVQNAIIGQDDSVTGGIIGASTLLTTNYVLVRFLSRHEKIERLIEGDPDVLIENGRIKTDCLRNEAISEVEPRQRHTNRVESLDPSIARCSIPMAASRSSARRRHPT
jgi:uncharacterized membrane protein YcaP (DUF421 family)